MSSGHHSCGSIEHRSEVVPVSQLGFPGGDAHPHRQLQRPLCGHREAGFVAEVQAVCRKLKALCGTTAHALFETCTATAVMEAGKVTPSGVRGWITVTVWRPVHRVQLADS